MVAEFLSTEQRPSAHHLSRWSGCRPMVIHTIKPCVGPPKQESAPNNRAPARNIPTWGARYAQNLYGFLDEPARFCVTKAVKRQSKNPTRSRSRFHLRDISMVCRSICNSFSSRNLHSQPTFIMRSASRRHLFPLPLLPLLLLVHTP